MKVTTVQELIEALTAMPHQDAIVIGSDAAKDGVSVIEQEGGLKVLICSPNN